MGAAVRSAAGWRLLILAGALWTATALVPRGAPAAQNLILNADLSRGGGNSPDHWRTNGWMQSPSTTTYAWVHPSKGALGELDITNLGENDARWVQSLSLDPGWYYLSVEVRTERVGPVHYGAFVSLLDDDIKSPDIRGDSDWKTVGFYLKVGPRGADVDVALRLGGYMNLTRGHAAFRTPSLIGIAAPPSGAAPTYDLDAIRKRLAIEPVGRPWTLAATYLLLLVLLAFGWWCFGAEPSPVAGSSRGRKSGGPGSRKADGDRRR